MANLIQIKRSLTAATPGSLANGELAFTSNGNILFVGANGAVEAIGGKRYPGTLTANQALVANATSYIDAVKVANATLDKVYANGSHGTAGYVLATGGSGANAYWIDPATISTSPGGSNTNIQYNDSGALGGSAGFTFNETTNNVSIANTLSVSGNITSSNTTTGTVVITGGLGVSNRINTSEIATGNDSVYSTLTGTTLTTANVHASATVNATILSVGGWVVANNSGVFTSGVVNGDIIQVGSAFIANTTQVTIGSGKGLSANGSVGSSGDILLSNGTSPYWIAASGLNVNNALTANSASYLGSKQEAALNVNSALTSNNSTYAFGKTEGNLNVNNALTANLATYIVANSGLVSNSSGVFVNANTGVTANSSGVFIGQSVGTSDNVTFNDITINGNTTLGNATSDIITPNALFAGSLVPSANVTYDLGTTTKRWKDLYLAGTTIYLGGTTLTDTSGVLSVTSANITADFTVTGNTKLGDSSSDVVSFIASVNTSIMPSANATYNLGNNTIRWQEVHAQNVHSEYLYIDKDVQISGNLYVTGNVTTINVATLSVTDSLIQLASNNTSSDLIDIGIYGNYDVSGGAHEHTGLFRDATDGVWKLFVGLQTAPTTTVDTAGTGYAKGTMDAYLLSGGLESNASNIAITANSTLAVAIVANTLTLSTPLAATSGGTGYNSYTAGDILTAANSSSLSKLTLGSDGYVLQSNGTALVYSTLDGGTF